MTNRIEEDIVEKLRCAIHLLYKNDHYFIDNNRHIKKYGSRQKKDCDAHHVGERAIMHKIAHYLENLMSMDEAYNEYDIDCEYNRSFKTQRSCRTKWLFRT